MNSTDKNPLDQDLRRFYASNPLEVLGINSKATDKDVIKAYRKLMLVWHPDKNVERTIEDLAKIKEIFDNITHAYLMETSPEYAQKHGGNQNKHTCRAKGELVGFRKSDKFKAKLKNWKWQGPDRKEDIIFTGPSRSNPSQSNSLQSKERLKQEFRAWLDQSDLTVKQVMEDPSFGSLECLPNLSVNFKKFLTENRLFETPLPTFSESDVILFKTNNFKEEQKLITLINTCAYTFLRFSLPGQKQIKEAQQIVSGIEEKYFYEQTEKVCRTLKNFINSKSHIDNINIPLIDAQSSEARQLSLIPTINTKKKTSNNQYSLNRIQPNFSHTNQLKEIPKPELNATICNICKQAFGIFNLLKTCTSCGQACCASCMTFKKFPEYHKPVRVCKSHGMQDYKDNWKFPLSAQNDIKKVTSRYLLFLDVAGFATRDEFKGWIKKFIDIGKYDLAAQCAYSAGGEWIELTKRLLDKGLFEQASASLDYLRNRKREVKDWENLSITERDHPDTIMYDNGKASVWQVYSQKDWLATAEKYAALDVGIFLLCYKKAFYADGGAYGLLDSAFQRLDHPAAPVLLQMALQTCGMMSKTLKEFADYIFKKEIPLKNQYSILGFFCLAKQASVDDWIDLINSLAIEHSQPLLFLLQHYLKPDWCKITLTADRDHFCWKYRRNPILEQWLDLFADSIEKGAGHLTAPYFKAHFKDFNWVSLRDDFLKAKQYRHALICHFLSPEPLSWIDLAKKIHKKNSSFSLLCKSLLLENLNVFGNLLFSQGQYDQAFKCYLNQGDEDKLLNCLNYIQAPEKLAHLKSLWEKTHKTNYLLMICQELVKLRAKDLLKKILIAIINEISPKENLKFFQMLYEHFDLTLQQKIGFFEAIASFCQASDEAWVKKTFEEIRIHLKKILFLAFQRQDYEALLNIRDLLTPHTWQAINHELNDFKEESMYGPYKSAVLFMQALLQLYHPVSPDYWATMAALNKAMLNHSSAELMPYYSKVIEKISELPPTGLKFEINKLSELQFPNMCEFAGRLKGPSYLKLLQLADQTLAKVSNKQAGLSYIDLTMTAVGVDGSIGSSLAASFEFLEILLQLDQPNKIYSYKKGIFDLVSTAFGCAQLYLPPPGRLYTYKACICILSAIFKKTKKISREEQEFINMLYNEYEKTFKVMPLGFASTLSLYDSIYRSYVDNMITNAYFKTAREKPQMQNDVKLQYEYLSGTWNNWLDEEDFNFNQERTRMMELLLKGKSQTFQQVESLLMWPPLVRDEEGWLPREPLPLFLSETHFSKVEGVTFDFDTGEVIFNFIRSDDPLKQLFDMNDVEDIFRGGIFGAQFTLEQADPELPYHPFQNMLYEPKSLSGTNYLGTLLHADYTLKMLSTGTEVCAKAPFPIRDATESLLERLPKDLQKKISAYYLEKEGSRADRFWIEAENLNYFETIQGNRKTYTFEDCKMSVKNHRLVKDKNGNLVDAKEEEDLDNLSAQGKFAKLLTEEYETIGNAFPEFARLGELAKIQAIFKFSLDIAISASKAKIFMAETDVDTLLAQLKKDIAYPIDARGIVDKILKDQNLSRYQVSYSELSGLEEKIAQQCRKQDQKNLSDIVDFVQKKFNIGAAEHSLLTSYAKDFLSWNSASLGNFLKEKIRLDGKSGALKICKTFENLGITFSEKKVTANGLSWVPTTYKDNHHQKVYGGVNMQPNLTRTPCAPGGIGSTLPPRGPFIAQYQHRIVMTPNGVITGTNVRVDPVTGNTYIDPYTNKQHIALTVSTCVRDQWNNNWQRPPNTVAFWKTGCGYTDLKKYTVHYDNQAVHMHRVNGYTTCIYNGQSSVYRPGKDAHRCHDK